MAADWSGLHLDLLTTIAMKLETFEDFIYFSVVCRWWNHASSVIKHMWRPTPVVPWLLLSETKEENPDCLRKMFNLSNNKLYQWNLLDTLRTRCWGSAYGWVVMVDRELNVKLFNPITKNQILFPPLETLPNLHPLYRKDMKRGKDITWFVKCLMVKLIVLKLFQGDHYEFVVMALYDNKELQAFARHGDQSWTSVVAKEANIMVDVLGMDNYVFALYDDGAVGYWDVDKFRGLEPIQPLNYSPGKCELFLKRLSPETRWREKYFVQSDSRLLAVLRYKDSYVSGYQTCLFEVYRLDPKEKRWEEIKDLGEVALFVGGSTSMSISVTDCKSLQRNCIYFTDDEFDQWNLPPEHGGLGGHDMGLYDMKCGKICRFYEGSDTRSAVCPPTFFIPQLFES